MKAFFSEGQSFFYVSNSAHITILEFNSVWATQVGVAPVLQTRVGSVSLFEKERSLCRVIRICPCVLSFQYC